MELKKPELKSKHTAFSTTPSQYERLEKWAKCNKMSVSTAIFLLLGFALSKNPEVEK